MGWGGGHGGGPEKIKEGAKRDRVAQPSGSRRLLGGWED